MSPSFKFLLFSQSTTVLANSLFMMALVILIYNQTGSALLASIITLLSVGAKLLSGFLAPLLMDRYKLKNLVIFSQAAQLFIFSLLLAYTIYIPTATNIAIYYFSIFAIAYLEGFSSPARGSLVPHLVNENKLVNANSLISISDQTLLLLGWSMGGILIAIFGAKNVLFITIVLFVLSAVSISFIRVQSINRDKSIDIDEQQKEKDRGKTLREGWQIIFTNPVLKTLIIMMIIEVLGGSIWIGAVTLVFVQDVLHKGEEWWGFINSSFALGSILGGLIVWRISKYVNKYLIMNLLLGAAIVTILTFTYSYTTFPLISLILVLLMGPAYQLRDIAEITTMQKEIKKEVLPKVYAARSTIYNAAFGISVFGIGLLVDLIGVQIVYVISALLLAGATIYGGISFSKINKLERLEHSKSQN